MALEILVMVKQVPDSQEVVIDPVTMNLNRSLTRNVTNRVCLLGTFEFRSTVTRTGVGTLTTSVPSSSSLSAVTNQCSRRKCWNSGKRK